jgi:alanine-glyoxylate transaminase/serine-glyoxylate transaminase/serine-pyruvate transaminase
VCPSKPRPQIKVASVVTVAALAPSIPSRAPSRLDLFTRHLRPKPFLELNTPFSTERSAYPEDDQGNVIKKKKGKEEEQVKEEPAQEEKKATKEAPVETPANMSSQPPHPALLIPGPIEFDDAVLQSMSHFRCVAATLATVMIRC